jgi:hypothetical protein
MGPIVFCVDGRSYEAGWLGSDTASRHQGRVWPKVINDPRVTEEGARQPLEAGRQSRALPRDRTPVLATEVGYCQIVLPSRRLLVGFLFPES